jgi:hypothetical protein
LGDPPVVGAPEATAVLRKHQLASAHQRRARTPVGAVREARSLLHLLAREALNEAVAVSERRHRRQQQPRRPPRPAIPKDRLEQLRVDLAFPPRTALREHQPGCARPTATKRLLIDHD